MTNEQDEIRSSGMDRRTFVKRAGVTGAMVWAAPAITTASRAFAQDAGSPDCGRLLADQGSGFVFYSTCPATAENNKLTNPTQVQVWLEGVRVLPTSIQTDVGSRATIAAGTLVAVYMLHSEGPADGQLYSQEATLVFDGEVLGGVYDWQKLLATDNLGCSTYTQDDSQQTNARLGRRYEIGSAFGATADRVSMNSSTVTVTTNQRNFPDQMRVFVACSPVPGLA